MNCSADEERPARGSADLSRAGDDQLVLVRELFHPRIAIMSWRIFVPLRIACTSARARRVVLGPEDVRVEDADVDVSGSTAG